MSQTTELILRIKEQGGEQLTKLSGNFKNLGQQATAANVNFKEVSAELRKIQQTSVNSINNLKGYANAWREIANSVEIGTAEFKQANAEAAKLEAQLKKVQPGGRGRLAAGAQIAGTVAGAGVFGGIEGAAGAGIGALIGGVPGAITGGAIGAQVGQFRQMLSGTASYAAEITKQRKALQLVTKDSGEYQRALAFIDKTSRDLAIPQEIITRQFTQLTASVKGAGGNVRDAEKAFIGVASGIRGTGGNLEQLDSALTATSQVFSKGKVSAEELRQQIGERLPGAFSLFAQSIDMTPQELDKALEKGQVSLQDFQRFAEKLFAEYGENAKIIADGPDAAGDRLKTALSRLNESVGSLLKPIGASFQNEFAKIVLAIDAGIQKLNEFLGLGKGRQGEINRVQFELNATEKKIKDIKAALEEKPGMGMTKQLTLDLATMQGRQARQFARLQALLAAELATKVGTQEPPSKLPEIDANAPGPKAKKIPIIRLADLINVSEETNALAKKELRLNELITQAKEKGYKYDEQVLPLLANALQANAKIAISEEKINDLVENKAEILKNGMPLQEYLTRLGVAQTEADTARTQRKSVFQKLQQSEFQIAKETYEAEISARQELDVLVTNNLIKSKMLTEEEKMQIDINKTLADIIGQFAGKLTSTELLEAIRKIRQSMEDLAKSTQGFGNQFGRAFADVVKSSGDLAKNLGSSLGNAFLGLTDIITNFVKTGKLEFSEFASSVLADLGKIFIQFSLIQTLKSIFRGTGFGSFLGFATGGVMTNNGPLPLRRYANGGIANSPQVAMFGERGPEAYVPLPDGRTIPVSIKKDRASALDRYRPMGGTTTAMSKEDAMAESGAGFAAGAIDVRYTVERINQVDYVTADQFQRGMTQAAAQGAAQGEQRTLKALQNNRSTRSRLGLR